ncbi:mitogen-activated protein kinase HOG1 [Colletotrichum abscissum]|uniref:Mitogen-activated protein kinase HOG1 n=1 Tax=Colletotrichum abscissum TaxID=1671311 RepID=A0A9P9X5A3_9PEZI|nr:mitogen-activated protein kinase HOG1 [Colletotrichum abscissum]
MSNMSSIEVWIRYGVMGENTILSKLSVNEFRKLLNLYPKFVATGLRLDWNPSTSCVSGVWLPLKKTEVRKKMKRKRNLELDCIKSSDQRRDCEFHHQCLRSSSPTTTEAAVEEAFRWFGANEHAFAVSKLQELLNESKGLDCKFEFATLVLSAKYPNQVPFYSPELQNCIARELNDPVADKDKWGKGECARKYALFQSSYTYIDGLVTENDEKEEIASAGSKLVRRFSRRSEHKPLPATFAVKSFSEFESVAVKYLSEIRILATKNMQKVMPVNSATKTA